MIGLEYILNLYNMQHIELAEELGIRKQNITSWIKKRQNIPRKYLPILEQIFSQNEKYFSKELDEIDKLEIQKEKLKLDLKPVVKKQEKQFALGDFYQMIEVPIYDKEEINQIEREIEKTKLVSSFKYALDMADKNPYIDTFKLVVELLEKVQDEVILHKTIEALSHYFDILPEFISSNLGQGEFEEEIFEVFDDHNF